MKRSTKAILFAFFTVLILMVVFPPYAIMKMEGDNIARHAFVGYHPLWDPPTKIFAYEFLEKKLFIKNDSPDFAALLSCYIVILNKVRFIGNVLLLSFIASVLLLIFRQRKQTR